MAPRARTAFAGSESALTKVVCSCGTKGLSSMDPLVISSVSVCRMAALTAGGKRSPTMRINGPVIWMTYGLSAAGEVRPTASPRAAADCSRSSGVPVISPCR